MYRIAQKNKQARIALLVSILLILSSIPLSALWMKLDSASRLFKDPALIPSNKVGLVLGCAQNIYFYHRVDAAFELYKAGKIEYILVSGDNHTVTYDEAGAMKKALVRRGIPHERIYCDYAGFSTIDSVVRAREVFGQRRLTIISQEFHVQRALFIAKRKNITATGYCAEEVETSIGAPTLLREQAARVKTVLDLYLLRRKPRYLGAPVQIGPQ